MENASTCVCLDPSDDDHIRSGASAGGLAHTLTKCCAEVCDSRHETSEHMRCAKLAGLMLKSDSTSSIWGL
eukprot:1150672-Pelagomonas_calceolata.AAC.4